MTRDSATAPPDPAARSEEAPPRRPSARVAELAEMSPARAAFTLAWPGIVEQLLRAGSQTIVLAFIGHLGAVALAASGAALQFMFLLFPVWNALSIGTVALVSRRLGEGRPREAAAVVRQSLVLGAVFGVASGVAFAVFAEPLLGLLGAEPDVAASGAPYLAVLGGFNVLITISFIGTAAMRAAGDTRTPMVISGVGSLLTLLAGYLTISVLGLGIIGYAWVSTGLNAALAAVTLWLLWSGRAGLVVRGGSWRLSSAMVRAIASISLPAAFESLIFSLGLLIVAGLVMRMGTEAFAAHQIVIQLESLSFLPCIGFAGAAAALVGQSLGLGRPERAMAVGWAAARMAALWTSVVGLVLVLFPVLWLGLFTTDAAVIAAGVGAVIVVGLGQPFQAIVFSLGGALRGAGDTRYTLQVTMVSWFVVRLPLSFLLVLGPGLGLLGVWLALVTDYAIRASLMAHRFRGGRWQQRRI